jgi:hypothetical protein
MKRANLERRRYATFDALRSRQPGDRVQQHYPISGQDGVGHLEEVVVAIVPEVFEGADRHDPVNGLVELFPAVQQHPLAARTGA